MKLLVVGGVAGGASAAARVRRIDADAEIVIFDKGEYVSYSNCSLPYYLGGIVADDQDLVMMWPESFKLQHDIEVRVLSEVTAIDREKKQIAVTNVQTGESYTESYDKLVLSPGARPVVPGSIKGVQNPNVFTVRNVPDVVKIRKAMAGSSKCAVIGGGFIGIEVAENLRHAGLEVSLIEGTDQVMRPFDYDIVQMLHKEMIDNGVKLMLNSTLKEVKEKSVIVERNGKDLEVEADFVVLAIGVRPETELAKDAGLEIGVTGGIKVNENFQTSDPDIYAVGDAIESYSKITGKAGRLPLAGPAQRQARAAADHMYGIPHHCGGYIGSSCIRVFGLNAASTGLNERDCRANGISCDSVLLFPNDRVGLMPNAHYLGFKLVFELPSGKILGAQAIGTGEADKRVDVIAALISMGGTLEDLKELELCYAPLFSTAKDVVNMAALVGLNILNGAYKQVHVNEVRGLVESGAFIIDVREEDEYEEGHLITSKNIPMSQLRGRLDEIPKDVPVYLHCRSSQRSYYCLCALKGRGFDNVVNISGSYLGISLYEYFDDVDKGRKPIVTAYNFN